MACNLNELWHAYSVIFYGSAIAGTMYRQSPLMRFILGFSHSAVLEVNNPVAVGEG